MIVGSPLGRQRVPCFVSHAPALGPQPASIESELIELDRSIAAAHERAQASLTRSREGAGRGDRAGLRQKKLYG